MGLRMAIVGSVERIACIALAMLMLLPAHKASAQDDGEAVVLDSRRYPVFAGQFSEFAFFQKRLQERLRACGREDVPVTSAEAPAMGRLHTETVAAIRAFADCRGADVYPEASKAREGVLTVAVWRDVMQEAPVPDATARAHAMVLSFEGTDFGELPEWNLCQDGFTQTPRGTVACINSSDPCSYLTWGPRGATAGQGREIQYILAEVGRRKRKLLQTAFGSEYQTLSRFYRARSGPRDSCVGQIPLKIFMCSVWSTPARRAIWEQALKDLGNDADVRDIYNRLYSAEEFDGGKMRAFFEMWNKLELPPSEVDFAFFLDRITHIGGPPAASPAFMQSIKTCIEGENAISRHGAARRCLSRLQQHSTQANYRTGRDVAYYLDAYQQGVIDEKEIKLWADYMQLSATHNFGLRDDRPVQLPKTEPLRAMGMELPPEADNQVLPSEAARCPAIVLTPSPAK